ncbi:tripartite tricarboxylate transporter substrate binding protein (plasmid) [Variovorax sp. V59]|uniref:Bug family tripartite tricarboxylate transporter substrate binding protein n=1 Tax=unclassified Variovorax TaxID=663243 RepID=UPI0034E865F0
MSPAKLIAAVLPLVAGLVSAHADVYPSAPVRLVVPFPPGGPVDLVARVISGPLGQELGQPIVVENKAGAGGNIAAGEVARAKADGYTLSMVYETHATANLFNKNYKFDAFDSFEYISLLGQSPTVLATSLQSGYDTLAKYIAALKARPEQINQAVPGPGAASMLKPELLNQALGSRVTYVPFSGAAPAFTALAGGQIDVVLASVPALLPLIQAKRVNAIAVGSAQPLPALPGVPPLSTVVPGYESTIWVGLVAPKGTPKAVTERIALAVRRGLEQPAVKKQLEDASFVVLATDRSRFIERARADHRAAQMLIDKGVLKADE